MAGSEPCQVSMLFPQGRVNKSMPGWGQGIDLERFHGQESLQDAEWMTSFLVATAGKGEHSK